MTPCRAQSQLDIPGMQKNFGVASASYLHNRHPDGIFSKANHTVGQLLTPARQVLLVMQS